MIAVPIALVLFGYWMLYAGVKRASLADAWNCAPQQGATQGNQSGRPGSISVTVPGGTKLTVTTDCTVRRGDTKLPIPGTCNYIIWRPLGRGIFGQVNGQLLGPCGG